MDSQDSSAAAAAAQPPLHHHHHHHHQPSLLQHHTQNVLMAGPPSQIQANLHQQPQPPLNTYQSFNPGPSVVAGGNNTIPHQQQNEQNTHFPFSSMLNSAPLQHLMPMDYSNGGNVMSPPTGGAGVVVGSGSAVEVVKRKRGRPRKYASDGSGNLIAAGVSPSPSPTPTPTPVAVTQSGGGGSVAAPVAEVPVKRPRGRPPGSGKKQLEALGIPGFGLMPHIIYVKPGEDISTRIMAFSQQGPRTVCILTATGAVCNVTLRQPASSGSGIVSHEGVFEIISLAGSFVMFDNNGGSNRTGGLSVALAREDGSMLGGGVAGMLKAASAIQIVVASFFLEEKNVRSMAAAMMPPPNVSSFANAAVTVTSPPSQGGGGGISSNSPDGSGSGSGSGSGNGVGSQLDQGAYANAGQQPMQNVPMYSSWGNNNMNMQHPN